MEDNEFFEVLGLHSIEMFLMGAAELSKYEICIFHAFGEAELFSVDYLEHEGLNVKLYLN